MFNGDLSGEVMKGVTDFNLRERPCNCNMSTLTNNKKCWFEGKCRTSMVIYRLYCKLTGKSYYGKTQQYLKTRTMKHVQDVWKVIESGRKSLDPTGLAAEDMPKQTRSQNTLLIYAENATPTME